MKIGQTSIVVFVSKVLASAIGFLGTVYFARTLGPEILGIYATIVAVITWLQITGKVGVHSALTKRLSEGRNRGAYLTAGILCVTVASILTILVVAIFRASVDAYISGFNEYVGMSVVWFLLILFALQITYHITNAILQGQHLVHITGLLQPIRTGLINGIQFVLIFSFGFGLLGLVVGHTIGLAITALIGILFVSIRPRVPNREQFASLLDYARFSWFGELSNRTFSNADILILSALVPSQLVGIYSVTWALSSFLNLFSGAISSAMFPKISSVAAQDTVAATTALIEDTVTYAGLIVIPGVVGGALLDDRLLKIYGTGFGQGTQVLWFLLLAILMYSYLSQFTTALNGLDRPDLVFRTNLVFIVGNVLLNIVLIRSIGWTGAAIASLASCTLGGLLAYRYLSRLVEFKIPVGEIGRQVTAAIVMGIVVWIADSFLDTHWLDGPNWLLLLGLVSVGAGTYVAILSLLSEDFRDTVNRNILSELPR